MVMMPNDNILQPVEATLMGDFSSTLFKQTVPRLGMKKIAKQFPKKSLFFDILEIYTYMIYQYAHIYKTIHIILCMLIPNQLKGITAVSLKSLWLNQMVPLPALFPGAAKPLSPLSPWQLQRMTNLCIRKCDDIFT